MTRMFLSANEAFAHGVRLARPAVISAYPITPQTTVVEKLSEMVADGELDSDFVHVESEHSAMSCAMGASAAGVRTFTATSSQGLLYMAECLPYAAGGRFPIVMMNANRSTALPWNIYGDQRDAMMVLDSGWIQAYAQDGQESLDMALMAYRVAEDPRVSNPFMVNLDGFHLTHTYEIVDVPEQSQVDEFLPPYETENRIDFEHPKNMAFSAGPDFNTAFKEGEHRALLRAFDVVAEAEEDFLRIFGRRYPGTVDAYRCQDADFVLVTLGSVSGLCRDVADELREEGVRAGVLRIRYLRPFPVREVAEALRGAKSAGVLEKDVSFGYAGAVHINVCSALFSEGLALPVCNRIAGLGGANISRSDVRRVFDDIAEGKRDVAFMQGGARWAIRYRSRSSSSATRPARGAAGAWPSG